MLTRGCDQRAAVILAGGEGSRLRSLTRRIAGHDVPKQFCPILSAETLVEATLRRVALTIQPKLTSVVVTRSHERFYAPLLEELPSRNLVVQPQNRGTAPAILYSLLRLAETAPKAQVAIFPSDHFVDDDEKFMRHVDAAFEACVSRPELTVLLGVTPQWPESSYGWIEPGREIGGTPAFAVHRFWEKPVTEVARRLFDGGCMWNSFVMVGQLSTLLSLFLVGLPELYRRFRKIRRVMHTKREEQKVERVYAGLQTTGFSERVLAECPVNLAVLPVRGVAWSDLGEPQRVMETIARAGIRPEWAAA